MLCALGAKMNAWEKRFPKANVGGPFSRAEFIMTNMRQGFENLQRIERNAPMIAQID